MITLAVVLLLHTPNGQPVFISPEQVTSMRPDNPKSGDHFHEGAHCLINLTDGKFVAVAETCDVVEKLLEGK